MKVFLIGMPGTGKSTLGKSIAQRLGLAFIDLDSAIEQSEECTIPEIFKKEGEAYFRDCESKSLKQYTESHDQFVMATGGGTPCFFDNMEFMNSSGISVYLNTPVTLIVNRLQQDTVNERPLIKNKTGQELHEFLTRMLDRRSPFYCRAAYSVENIDLKSEEIYTLLESQSNG